MAIDRTGISSLNAGAAEITYSGSEGPKSPEQQLMAQADPMLIEMYQQYVFEMKEQGLQPMSFKEFEAQARAGMNDGGRAGFKYGGGPDFMNTYASMMPDSAFSKLLLPGASGQLLAMRLAKHFKNVMGGVHSKVSNSSSN